MGSAHHNLRQVPVLVLPDALHNIVNLGQSVTKEKKNLQNALLNPSNTQSVLDNIHTRKLDQHS